MFSATHCDVVSNPPRKNPQMRIRFNGFFLFFLSYRAFNLPFLYAEPGGNAKFRVEGLDEKYEMEVPVPHQFQVLGIENMR